MKKETYELLAEKRKLQDRMIGIRHARRLFMPEYSDDAILSIIMAEDMAAKSAATESKVIWAMVGFALALVVIFTPHEWIVWVGGSIVLLVLAGFIGWIIFCIIRGEQLESGGNK